MAKKKDKKEDADNGLGGILKGLSDLMGAIGDLAEKGEAFAGEREFQTQGDKADNPVKGVFGFSVKTGLGGKGVKVEPFGNVRKDKKSGEAVVREIREPMVDIFEEKNHILLVAEMPGIEAEDIKIELEDDILTIYAEKKTIKYRKEILLPGTFDKKKISVTSKNGIVEIKCKR